MSTSQKIVLAVGIAAVVIMGLYPPWVVVDSQSGYTAIERAAGYHPLWKPQIPESTAAVKALLRKPSDAESFSSMRVNLIQLCLQTYAALMLSLTGCAVLYYTSRKRRE